MRNKAARLSVILLCIMIIVIAAVFFIKRQQDEAVINQLANKLANTPAFIEEQKLLTESQEKLLTILRKRKRIRWPVDKRYSAFRKDFADRFSKGIIDTTLNSKLWNDSEAVAMPVLDFHKINSLMKEWLRQNPEFAKLPTRDKKKVLFQAHGLVPKLKRSR